MLNTGTQGLQTNAQGTIATGLFPSFTLDMRQQRQRGGGTCTCVFNNRQWVWLHFFLLLLRFEK